MSYVACFCSSLGAAEDDAAFLALRVGEKVIGMLTVASSTTLFSTRSWLKGLLWSTGTLTVTLKWLESRFSLDFLTMSSEDLNGLWILKSDNETI